jgi:hypothetical protein
MSPSTDTSIIDTRQAFAAALHAALDLALAQRARRMFWVDADFADWPLDAAAALPLLGDWLRLPQRHLVLLAAQPEALRRRARFMEAYRLWSHALSVFAPAADDAAALPCLLLAEDTVCVHVLDKPRWRGRSSQVPAELRTARDNLDALLQRSEPALPATVLGL